MSQNQIQRTNRYQGGSNHYDHKAWLAQTASEVNDASRNVESPINMQQYMQQQDDRNVVPIHVDDSGGKQADTAELIAKGTRIKTEILLKVSLPITIGIVGLAIWSGVLSSVLSIIVAFLVLWGSIILFGYSRIVRNDLWYSYYGVKHHSIDEEARVRMHRQDSQERVLIETLHTYERMNGPQQPPEPELRVITVNGEARVIEV